MYISRVISLNLRNIYDCFCCKFSSFEPFSIDFVTSGSNAVETVLNALEDALAEVH